MLWCSWRKFEKYPLFESILYTDPTRLNTTTSLIAFVISASNSLLLHCSTATQTLRWIWFVYRFQAWALLFVPRLMHILLSFNLIGTSYILFTTPSFHNCSVLQAHSFWSTLLPSLSLICASFTKMRILSSLPLWSLSFHCHKYFILSSCSCRTARPTEVLHDVVKA